MSAATVYSGIQPLSSTSDTSLYPTGTSSLSSLYPFSVNFANGNNTSNPVAPPMGLSAGIEGIDDFFQTLDVELAGWDNALDPAVPYPLPGFESHAAGPSTAGDIMDGGGLDFEDAEGYMDPTCASDVLCIASASLTCRLQTTCSTTPTSALLQNLCAI